MARMSFWLTIRSSRRHLELGAGVLGVQDPVAFLDVHLLARAVIEDLAGAGSEDDALLRLLLAVSGRTMPLLVMSREGSA